MTSIVPRLISLAAAAAAAGCAVVPPSYLLIPPTSVALRCRDGYMAFNDSKAKRVLITPYPASEAQYAICTGGEGLPLRERARKAAEKHLGAKCAITGASEPLALSYEFTYSCS